MSAGLDPRACFDTSATTDGEVSYHLPSTPTVAGSRWVNFLFGSLKPLDRVGTFFSIRLQFSLFYIIDMYPHEIVHHTAPTEQIDAWYILQ